MSARNTRCCAIVDESRLPYPQPYPRKGRGDRAGPGPGTGGMGEAPRGGWGFMGPTLSHYTVKTGYPFMQNIRVAHCNMQHRAARAVEPLIVLILAGSFNVFRCDPFLPGYQTPAKRGMGLLASRRASNALSNLTSRCLPCWCRVSIGYACITLGQPVKEPIWHGVNGSLGFRRYHNAMLPQHSPEGVLI